MFVHFHPHLSSIRPRNIFIFCSRGKENITVDTNLLDSNKAFVSVRRGFADRLSTHRMVVISSGYCLRTRLNGALFTKRKFDKIENLSREI